MATKYVRTDGSNANDGTVDDAAHAWLTTTYAVGINALNFETGVPAGVGGLNLEGYDSTMTSIITQFNSNISFKSNTTIGA